MLSSQIQIIKLPTYPKIETLFGRDENFKVDISKTRRPIFGSINLWHATEKIDGTNIRIIFTRYDDGLYYDVRGKNDTAQIPSQLLANCWNMLERIKDQVFEIMNAHNIDTYILFGEGYGPKIQSGGHYRDDQAFILYDVLVNGTSNFLFLSDDAVTSTAKTLDLPRVPYLGTLTLDEIIELVGAGFHSWEANDSDFLAEGIVARPLEPLYLNNGERVIFKIKTRDFPGVHLA